MNLRGYALAAKLREEAADIRIPERADLMREAATEIEFLVNEIKNVVKVLREQSQRMEKQ